MVGQILAAGGVIGALYGFGLGAEASQGFYHAAGMGVLGGLGGIFATFGSMALIAGAGAIAVGIKNKVDHWRWRMQPYVREMLEEQAELLAREEMANRVREGYIDGKYIPPQLRNPHDRARALREVNEIFSNESNDSSQKVNLFKEYRLRALKEGLLDEDELRDALKEGLLDNEEVREALKEGLLNDKDVRKEVRYLPPQLQDDLALAKIRGTLGNEAKESSQKIIAEENLVNRGKGNKIKLA